MDGRKKKLTSLSLPVNGNEEEWFAEPAVLHSRLHHRTTHPSPSSHFSKNPFPLPSFSSSSSESLKHSLQRLSEKNKYVNTVPACGDLGPRRALIWCNSRESRASARWDLTFEEVEGA